MIVLKEKIRFTCFLLLLSFLFVSCSKNFLNTKPLDTISTANFYSTNDQVAASTNILYGAPWWRFNQTLMWDVGDAAAGNGRMWPGTANYQFFSFSVTGLNQDLVDGWTSLWSVVAQCNALINNLSANKNPNVSTQVINQALGEAHVMRAVAYLYMVRVWGPVPIITNNSADVANPSISLNTVDDIYKFIKMDLQFGIDYCEPAIRTNNYASNAHISKGTAMAYMAKVDLRLKDYKDAASLSEQVIQSGEFQLLPDYADLFQTAYNNNPESVLSLQWIGNQYGMGQEIQFYYAYSSDVNQVAGFGTMAPSIDLMRSFLQAVNIDTSSSAASTLPLPNQPMLLRALAADTMDKRVRATFMIPGTYYSYLNSANGGYTVPEDIDEQGMPIGIKKYVSGTASDNGGSGDGDGFPNNTYLMRYAEVLLINAEAILQLNGGTSTSDPEALQSYNAVRTRAGLPPRTSITEQNIINCRRREFAFEGDYWHTLTRVDAPKTLVAYLQNQERGTFEQNVDGSWGISSINLSPSPNKLTWPYPNVDVDKNKLFTQAPQSFDFNTLNFKHY